MPLEIKELCIKATVGGAPPAEAGTDTGEDKPKKHAQLANNCVEKVMKILRDKSGR